jgi:hypothetical protein
MTDDDMREMLADIVPLSISSLWDESQERQILRAMAAVRAATIEECARVASDYATAADAEFLAWKSRAEASRDGLSMAGGCAIGLSHQARRIAAAIRALSKGQGE